ncbi:MAG: hypothetical protein GYA33_14115 [Thermogutta sp.]|nr:hypothetical protein [Thermogutta sp.]
MGKLNRKAAESIRGHVEALLEARRLGQPVRAETHVWLESIGEGLRAKLIRYGLIDGKPAVALSEAVEAYLKRKATSIKPGSLVATEQTLGNLLEYFGLQARLTDIHPGGGGRLPSMVAVHGPKATTSKAPQPGDRAEPFCARQGILS